MARTPPAPVARELLIWARESLGLSQEEAAKKIGVKPERLAEWEAGDASPTVAQLRAAANVYKRPVAVFFLSEPPRGFQALKDFRRLPDAPEARWSPALRLAVRRARHQRETLLELLRLLGNEAPVRPTVDVSTDDPEAFAGAARDLLSVSLDEQQSWRDRYRALSGWSRALEENVGVLVLQASGVALDEMRGFSMADHEIPVMVLNARDAPRGRIFTAMHEYTHVLLNNAGVCDLHDSTQARSEEERVERFCNEAAGAILLPASALADDPIISRAPRSGEWDDEEIGALAERYSVSQEAVVRRLVSLQLTSWAFYHEKRRAYREAYERRREEEEGFAPYHRVRVRDLGRAYVRLVLEAYHRDQINTSEVSDYLGVRLKHLPKIEDEALRTGSRT
jgi:Zn-dependent peptidase ImmA (M78 family)/DNA-binding XRE family transcriptional regulator